MNADNVTAAKPKIAGSVFSAPVGTALPTDASTALNEAFVEQGYVTEDGITNSNSPESTEIKAWGGAVVLTPNTGRPDNWSMGLMETLNGNAAKIAYGDSNVTVAANGDVTIKANASDLEDRSWVIDMILNGGYIKRVVLPKAKVTELGDITYKDDEAVVYSVTLNAKADAEGNTHYEYITKTAA